MVSAELRGWIDKLTKTITYLDKNIQIEILTNTPTIRLPCTQDGLIEFIRFIKTVLGDIDNGNRSNTIRIYWLTAITIFTTEEGNMEVNGMLMDEFNQTSSEFLGVLTEDRIETLTSLGRLEPVVALLGAIDKFYNNII